MDGQNSSRLASIFSTYARQGSHEPNPNEKVMLGAIAEKLEKATWEFNLLKPQTANTLMRMAGERCIQLSWFEVLEFIKILRTLAGEEGQK